MRFQKVTAILAAFAVLAASVTWLDSKQIGTVFADASLPQLEITEAGGRFESAYVEWTSDSYADSYNVYVKGESFAEYTVIDKELIRYYGDYYRADAMGLPEGEYTLKVEAVADGSVTAVETEELNVKAYTREGFAFSENSPAGTASGGYNDDGSLSENANVIYITADNVKTVQSTIYVDSKAYECTGLEEIIQYLAKNKEPRKTVIRIIGTIMAPVTDRYTGEVLSSRDDVGSGDYVINSNGYMVFKKCSNITVEGVGDDATLKGIGLLIREATNFEVRNLGVMLFSDDGISMDTANNNVWVHNNDVFYGMPGSDSDQAKGDGSIDCKKSHYITISDNHIWDGGKASLLDASATTDTDSQSNYITYHHNWFDHSDSRHPRIRHATVHVYNNYFDGVSKYGIGVTSGASVFAEANVFRNCANPFFSSSQGNEGGNVLSGETGGIIKAYNNSITGDFEVIYASANNRNNFDAYLASSRDEKISSEYTTLVSVDGSDTFPNTYNNFDTDSAVMYEYTADSTDSVVAAIEAYAGRGSDADFVYEFDDETADTSSGIDETLKAKLGAYESALVYSYASGNESYPPTGIEIIPTPTPTPTVAPSETPTETPATPTPTVTPTEIPSVDGEAVMWYAGDDVAAGDTLTIPGLTAVGKMSGGSAEEEIDGLSFTGRARGSSNASADGKSGASIQFIPESDGVFTVYYKSDKTTTFYIKDSDGNVIAEYTNNTSSNITTCTSAWVEEGKTYYAFVSGKRVYFYGASFAADIRGGILPIGDYIDKVEISEVTADDSSAEYTISALDESIDLETITLYAAGYDESGCLTSLTEAQATLSDGVLTLSAELPKDDTVKLMFWDGNNSPVTEVIIK